jgi:hypothetical protein
VSTWLIIGVQLAANSRAHLTSLEAGIQEREAALLKRLQLAEEDQTLATTTVEVRSSILHYQT